MKTEFTLIEYSFLTSLGLTFDSKPLFSIQPEKGLADLLNRNEFIGNYMYGMLKLFLQNNHEFIRTDVLEKEAANLSPVGKATLSALFSFCSKELKDKRFSKIPKYSLHSPLILNSEEYIQSVGAETHLYSRGIKVRDIKPQDSKKIRPSEWILKNNIWFKNRLIFGLGVRADAFSALETRPIKTYYELSKILNSSITSARKNYQDFYRIKEIDPRFILSVR
jgi:hypothetical protein